MTTETFGPHILVHFFALSLFKWQVFSVQKDGMKMSSEEISPVYDEGY